MASRMFGAKPLSASIVAFVPSAKGAYLNEIVFGINFIFKECEMVATFLRSQYF